MTTQGSNVSTSTGGAPERPERVKEVAVGVSQDRNYARDSAAVDNRSLTNPDGARLFKAEPVINADGYETDLRTSGFVLAWVMPEPGMYIVDSNQGVFIKPFGDVTLYADTVTVTNA